MNPLVSIIIPNYNHADYLEQRIDSVLSQSYFNFEVILLDDASTDNSVSIINAYKEQPKVAHLIINPINSGSVFKQWLRGLELAKGDYIWIAESDDYADEQFLQQTMESMLDHKDCALVFSDSYMVNQHGSIKSKLSEFSDALRQFSMLDYENPRDKAFVFPFFINDLVVLNVSSALFKKEALLQIDPPFLTSLKNAGDLYTYMLLVLNHNLVYIDMPLNYYRSHDENTTSKNIALGYLHQDRIRVISYFISELAKLKDCKPALKLFLKRHLNTAIKFKQYTDLLDLIKHYYKNNIIHFTVYFKLKMYIKAQKYTNNSLPIIFKKRVIDLLIN